VLVAGCVEPELRFCLTGFLRNQLHVCACPVSYETSYMFVRPVSYETSYGRKLQLAIYQNAKPCRLVEAGGVRNLFGAQRIL
jgi:hypothetical protein